MARWSFTPPATPSCARTFLGRDEAYLWPDAVDQQRLAGASRAELVTLYPHRSAVPTELWLELLSRAGSCIEVLAYAALFLPELDPRIVDDLAARAEQGAAVRIALGDVQSDAVRLRGEEEGIGQGMAARVTMTLAHLAPLVVKAKDRVVERRAVHV